MIVKIFLVQLLFVMQLSPEVVETGSVSINFSGIKKWQGNIQVSLFKDAKGFPNREEAAIKTYQIKVEKGNTTVKIPNLPYGNYAISCYHDSNKNKKLDTNFFGIPKEKVGASNNPPSGSIPSFKDAKFALKSTNLALSIQLN